MTVRRMPAITLALVLTFTSSTRAQTSPEHRQHAPADAYREGSRLADYGSAGPWGRQTFSERNADRFYKRRAQRQLLAILDGNPQLASQWCRRRIAEDPEDLESRFMLTVALCQLNDPDAALIAMREAIEAGLPPSRFVAGPRDLLETLTQLDDFRHLLDESPCDVVHGPLLGAMTDNSLRCWIRTADESVVNVRVFESVDGKLPLQIGESQSKADRDYTAVVNLHDLDPDTTYFYDLIVDQRPSLGGQRFRFRTYPREQHAGRFSVAFGGGAGYTPSHESIWDTIASRRPAAFLFLGDNVYIDLPEHPGAFHRYTYYRRQSRPEFRRLVRSTPSYAIWDDHDCGTNDVWLGPEVGRPSWKLPMLDLFHENWNNPAGGGEGRPGCWHRFRVADVEFFMLDCRFYRTNPLGDQRTMLGPHQKAWLLEELKGSDAEFKVIASSVPWALGTKPGSQDTWDGFPAEREEIFSWIESNRIQGVLLLSADRHRSDAWKISRPSGAAFYDLMSSRLTNIHSHARMPEALFSYNEQCSFGLLHFDTLAADPTVDYQIVNQSGEVVYSLQLTKSQLPNSRPISAP